MSNSIIESWGPRIDQRQPTSPEVVTSRKRLFQKELEVVASMHRAGVKLLPESVVKTYGELTLRLILQGFLMDFAG